MRAHDFFAKHVEPAVADWRANELDERLAMNAAVALNQMADHYFHSLPAGDGRLLGASSVGTLRDALERQEPAFSLIRDVADAHKHVKLDRKHRKLSSADQTNVGTMGWDDAEWGVAKWDSPPELVVTLDTGKRRHFRGLIETVFTMWQRLL
jgi:hypothetical protein